MTEFTPPARSTDMLRLPSGDWIKIDMLDAGRVSEKANRKTGEIAGTVYLCVAGSWYQVNFESKDDAHAFLDQLIEHRNNLVAEPERGGAALSRAGALELIAQIHAGDEAAL